MREQEVHTKFFKMASICVLKTSMAG